MTIRRSTGLTEHAFERVRQRLTLSVDELAARARIALLVWCASPERRTGQLGRFAQMMDDWRMGRSRAFRRRYAWSGSGLPAVRLSSRES